MKKVLGIVVMLMVPLIMLFGCGMVGGSTSRTLSWDAPTTNEDGTPCTDLAGFELCWSKRSIFDVVYDPSIDTCIGIVGADNTTYTVDDLTPGMTYYFRVTAYDTSGNKSGPSNEAGATI